MAVTRRYALLIASHNLSFRSAEHIIELSKQIFKDSELSTKITQKRTKCTKLVSTLQNKPFSILVDESTDISNTKLLCILVRYEEQGKLKTQLLDILKINTDDGTAKGLHTLFKKTIVAFNLNISNVVGYCSDNANVMMGHKETFKTYLLQDNPHVIINGCICHSAHLVAVAAAEKIPSNVEALLQNLFLYFSRSPKRQPILEELQNYFNKAQLKIIGSSKTRWLALLRCVERVLDQWDILLHTFRLVVTCEEKNLVSKLILDELQNPYEKAYLTFSNLFFRFPTILIVFFSQKKY